MSWTVFSTPRLLSLLAGALGLAPALLTAQADAPPGVYVIFDGSGSMWGQLPDASYKIHVAKEVVSEFVGRDFGSAELAFRAYGHRREGDCSDTELIADFGPPASVAERVRGFMAEVNPLGRTPITRSLSAALDDFGDRSGEIILISDGIETCDPPPCELMAQWREAGVAIRVHVVGFGLQADERESLECIAETTGAEYRDAQSASDLETGLADIYDRAVTTGFRLVGRDPSGTRVPVSGVLSQSDLPRFEVESNRRNQVESGTYSLVAGVMTRNGELYEPVRIPDVVVRDEGETTIEVDVSVPPRVWARFTDDVGEQRGGLVTAFQSGTEVFSFRWMDTVFVAPGTYEFRARPNDANELSVTREVSAGSETEVLFEMARTVRVRIAVLASSGRSVFRQNTELWRNGERAYRVHRVNGAQVLPGTYTVRMDEEIFAWEQADVTITDEETQDLEFVIPTGTVTFHYLASDGTREAEKRTFVRRAGDRDRVYVSSGDPYALPPGQYEVVGWPDADVYGGPVPFEIRVGEDLVVELRPR